MIRILVTCLILLAAPALAAPSPAHITSNGPTPTADCGTVVGTDSAGKITVTVTTAPSICTLTFAQPWSGPAPSCVAGGPQNMSQLAISTTVSVDFHHGDQPGGPSGELLSGDVITYLCIGH